MRSRLSGDWVLLENTAEQERVVVGRLALALGALNRESS